MPGWVTAAIVIPVVTFGAVATARWVGRWFTRAMHDTFADAVNEIVAPPIDRHLADHEVLVGPARGAGGRWPSSSNGG